MQKKLLFLKKLTKIATPNEIFYDFEGILFHINSNIQAGHKKTLPVYGALEEWWIIRDLLYIRLYSIYSVQIICTCVCYNKKLANFLN